MNYEEMSDDEIAVRVLHAAGYKSVDFGDGYEILLSKDNRKDVGPRATKKFKFDPCNNPSDAWPIMRDCLIGVSPDEDGVTCHFYGDWTASAFCSQLSCTHKNPLRAAMVVFLMMQEQAK